MGNAICSSGLFISLITDISDVLKEAPNKHELLEQLLDIDNMWFEIGLAFKVGDNILSDLRQRQYKNIFKLNDVLQSWITSKSSPVTWDTVITAMEGHFVRNIQKAQDIRSHLQSICK